MAYFDDTEETRYKVVVNYEEQYSIWPSDKSIPSGWTATGVDGSKSECLVHIGTVWTDIRPLSLRMRMQRQAESATGTTE